MKMPAFFRPTFSSAAVGCAVATITACSSTGSQQSPSLSLMATPSPIALRTGLVPAFAPGSDSPVRPDRRKSLAPPDGAPVTILIDPSQIGATQRSEILGGGVITSFNLTKPGIADAFTHANLHLVRFPGGGQSDIWHWKTGTDGSGACLRNANTKNSWENFVTQVVEPANLDVAVQVNYGSNPKCTGGANPQEAADWVAAAPFVHWWTVGNEIYYASCTPMPGCALAVDLHPNHGTPESYARYEPEFYDAMKPAGAKHVCIDGMPQQKSGVWDNYVLTHAKYDCVEVHFYAERAGSENDEYLLKTAPADFVEFIETERRRLRDANREGTPIYVAESNAVSNSQGKQSQSIVDALFAGQMIAQAATLNVARMAWHAAFAQCNPEKDGGNFSRTLYGWQDWGSAAMFSGANNNCPQMPAFGTLLPTADSFLVASYFIHDGERMIGATVTGKNSNVVAYAATQGSGYALFLFNLDENAGSSATVSISGRDSGPGGHIVIYNKGRYDNTRTAKWSLPGQQSLPPWHGSFAVTLRPWSETVVQIK
jgi:hypothetical protein